MSRFRLPQAFVGPQAYRILPFRFRRLPWDMDRAFVSSMAGDWLVMGMDDVQRLVSHELTPDSPLFADLEARHLVMAGIDRSSLSPLLSQIRSRKSYILGGPALHIFVVSLRCHHTCSYCQVSRQETTATQFDMTGPHAEQAVERLFEWPSQELTIEFQGGEPLLNVDQVMAITRRIVERNQSARRSLRFVLASTLHDLTETQLAFLAEHRFKLSTSLDGPEWLHNANRPRPGRDSYRRTLDGIELGRKWLGAEGVSALTTLTRRSLE
ncbi:MAG: radical SAM protein, partial [Pseudomonas fluorescens]